MKKYLFRGFVLICIIAFSSIKTEAQKSGLKLTYGRYSAFFYTQNAFQFSFDKKINKVFSLGLNAFSLQNDEYIEARGNTLTTSNYGEYGVEAMLGLHLFTISDFETHLILGAGVMNQINTFRSIYTTARSSVSLEERIKISPNYQALIGGQIGFEDLNSYHMGQAYVGIRRLF